MYGPEAHLSLPSEQGNVKKPRNCQEIVSLSCLSSCVSPEELSFEGQRGEFEYAHRAMEAALKLPFGQNNSMYSLAACSDELGPRVCSGTGLSSWILCGRILQTFL